MTQIDLNTMLQASEAPEVRLPDRYVSRGRKSFYIALGCVMAIGLSPLVIGWAAVSMLL